MPLRITSSVTSVSTRVWYTVARIGTTATAANQGRPGTGTGGGADVGAACEPTALSSTVMVGDRSESNRSFLLLVVSHLDLGHVPGGLLGPGGVTVPMRDDYLGRETGTQERPSVVLLNPDAN